MLVFIANQLLGNKIATGGDILFCEILRREISDCVVIAPLDSKDEILKFNPNITFIPVGGVWNGKTASYLIGGISVLILYIKRGYSTFKILKNMLNKENVKIYLTGDFICNSLPFLLLELNGITYRSAFINFYHRNPGGLGKLTSSSIVGSISRIIQYVSLKLLCRYSNTAFVLSEIGKRELMNIGYKGKICISGAGINHPNKKYLKANKKENLLLYIGRLNVTKGIFDLLNVLTYMKDNNINYQCKVIGSGSDDDIKLIKKIISEKRLSIEIIGYCSEEEKIALMAKGNILIFPSREEGFGITIMEALSYNMKVVAYNLEVLMHIYGDYENIHFVDYLDYENMANKVISLINSKSLSKIESNYSSWDSVYEIQNKILN